MRTTRDSRWWRRPGLGPASRLWHVGSQSQIRRETQRYVTLTCFRIPALLGSGPGRTVGEFLEARQRNRPPHAPRGGLPGGGVSLSLCATDSGLPSPVADGPRRNGPLCSAKTRSALRSLLFQPVFAMQTAEHRRRFDAVPGWKLVSMWGGRDFGLGWFRDSWPYPNFRGTDGSAAILRAGFGCSSGADKSELICFKGVDVLRCALLSRKRVY